MKTKIKASRRSMGMNYAIREVTVPAAAAKKAAAAKAAACAARSDDCFLATGDRDSLQLVSESTTVLLAVTAMGRSKTVTMDTDAIQEKYGLAPKQLIEVKSLMGDASDNIPGVKGIGEKTALSLVQAVAEGGGLQVEGHSHLVRLALLEQGEQNVQKAIDGVGELATLC